ncbi:hypothetical protein [Micromonospora sp. IBHARD004]|uniref:hypothetical protein n=1 Tax=Micromonospora sp. IBHARD004 TaxID=3457764 RepID=UPI004059AD15
MTSYNPLSRPLTAEQDRPRGTGTTHQTGENVPTAVYDFPHKIRGVSSANRELRRLDRAILVAEERRDKTALDYLTRRRARALQALAAMHRREAA